MKRSFTLIITFSAAIAIGAQTPTSTPPPPIIYQNEPFGADRIKRGNDGRARIDGAGSLRKATNKDLLIYRKYVDNLYRDPTDAELRFMMPNAEDLREYSDLIRSNESGITRLVPDIGCANHENVVSANPVCLRLSMPGAGASFSFRTKTYRISRLADITFTGERFRSSGIMVHGIFAEIGDVPIREVSMATKGMRFIKDFRPSADLGGAIAADRQLIEGQTFDGFSYQRAAAAKVNTTYVVRSIAYRATFLQAIQGITYDEFQFDKRRDVTVVFRVIRQHPNGSVTIAWRTLDSQKSPKLQRIEDQAVPENRYAERTISKGS